MPQVVEHNIYLKAGDNMFAFLRLRRVNTANKNLSKDLERPRKAFDNSNLQYALVTALTDVRAEFGSLGAFSGACQGKQDALISEINKKIQDLPEPHHYYYRLGFYMVRNLLLAFRHGQTEDAGFILALIKREVSIPDDFLSGGQPGAPLASLQP